MQNYYYKSVQYRVHTYFGPVPSKDMQTRAHPLSYAPIFLKDGLIAELNEKSILRFFLFLIFQLWLIVFTIYQKAG